MHNAAVKQALQTTSGDWNRKLRHFMWNVARYQNLLLHMCEDFPLWIKTKWLEA